MLLTACAEGGASASVKSACAIAQDAEVSFEALLDAIQEYEAALLVYNGSVTRRDVARRQEVEQLIDSTATTTVRRDESAVEAARVVQEDARQAWETADGEFVADLRRFSRSASRSGAAALEATASSTRTRDKATTGGGLQAAFAACDKAGAPVRVAPSVKEALS